MPNDAGLIALKEVAPLWIPVIMVWGLAILFLLLLCGALYLYEKLKGDKNKR